MKETVLLMLKLCVSLLVVFGAALFEGWVFFEVYELGVRPILLEAELTIPHIDWVYFVPIALGWRAILLKGSNEKYDIANAELWAKLTTNIIGKLIIIFILYIFNSVWL